MSEVSLSNRIKTHPDFLESQEQGKIIFVDDVKEFVKELKKEMYKEGHDDYNKYVEENINRLVGDKLY